MPQMTQDAAHWEAVEEAAELLQEARYQDALYALRDVVKADPANPYAFYFMGVGLYEISKLAEARDAFRVAVRLSPGYVGARGALAQVLRRLHDYSGAIDEAEAALRLSPTDPDALHARGLALAALGRRDAARDTLLAFLETKPELEAAMEARQVIEMLNVADGPLHLDS